jgi:hypothetical protein
MSWQQMENTLHEMWFCLTNSAAADILEAYDPDWITHFIDEDKAYRAYRDDAEFQDLLREYHASL